MTDVIKVMTSLPIIVVENFSPPSNLYYFDPDNLVIFDIYFSLPEICFNHLSENYSNFSLQKKIDKIQSFQEESIKNHLYLNALMMIPDAFRFYCLNYNPNFPEEDKFKLWIKIYEHIDYGAPSIEDLREIVSHSSVPAPDLSSFQNNEITIFRGEGSLSKPLEEALSWTTKEKVAIFFACRGYPGVPKSIYKATVSKTDVLAHLSGRNEDEIIAFPENIRNVTKLDIFPLKNNSEFSSAIDMVVDSYNFYSSFVLPEWYSESAVHGIGHMHRVLFFALLLINKDKDFQYSETDIEILCYFAVLHDIGRQNDREDLMHGESSVKKIRDQNICYSPVRIIDKDLEWAKLFIKLHCLPDETGYAAIEKFSDSYREQVHMHYLFDVCKDIDALDRFRINDFDPKFLRTKIAHKLIFWAFAASSEIK